ncbi:MAG: PAS domain S-box protein [Methanospirillum sp.]|nr:PAS domain S-box protein [Methanospirillum sp.]
MDNYLYYISRIRQFLHDNHEGVTLSEIAGGLSMSRNTAGKYLELLYISGVVDFRNAGKAKLYYLSSKIPVTHLLSYITTSVIQTDGSYQIRDANTSATELLDSDEGTLIGRNILDLLSMQGLKPEIRSKILSSDRSAAYVSELELMRSGSRRLYWMTIVDVVLYDGGMGHIFFFEDIHEWKEAEEEKNRYRTMFHALAEETDERVFVMTPDLVFSFVNAGYGSALGRDPGSLTGEKRAEFYDARSRQLMVDAAEYVSAKGKPYRSLIPVEVHDSVRWFEERLFPVENISGEVKEIIGISRDITGFQEGGSATVLLSVLMDLLHEAVITSTPAGTVLSWNRGAELMTGYPRDELVGSSVLSIITPELNGERNIVEETVSGADIRELKAVIWARGGRKKRVLISTSRLSVQGGIISGICIVIREP